MPRRSIGLAVATATALVLLGWLLWPSAEPIRYRAAQATVVQGSECGGTDRFDVVRVQLRGDDMRARLQGCGHRPGEVLDVEVPMAGGGDVVVRLAGTGVAPERTTEERLGAVLAVTSAAGGAVLAWRLRDRPLR